MVQVTDRFTGSVTAEGETLREALHKAPPTDDGGHNLSSCYLRGADLRGLYGAHWDFSDANLLNADFTGAVLTGADFTGAVLTGATFTGADMRYANLSRANLQHAEFYDSSLRDALFLGADFLGARLRGAKFRGAHLDRVDLSRVDFYQADFTGVHLPGVPAVPGLSTREVRDVLDALVATYVDSDRDLDVVHWSGGSVERCLCEWIVGLAGQQGRQLEGRFGTGCAATLLLVATVGAVPDFFLRPRRVLAEARKRVAAGA